MSPVKLIRICTIPGSLNGLLQGQLKYMTEQGFEVVAVASGGKSLKKVEEKEGVRTIPVEMTRTISPLKDLLAVWKLYRVIKKEKPLIVHTHTPKAGTLGMLAAWVARVPHRLHTVAGMPLLEARGIKRAILDFVEKLTYACATKVYPNSHGLLQLIVEGEYAGLPKLKVIGSGSSNGIDTSYFDPTLNSLEDMKYFRKSQGIEDDDFVFVFVGRIVKDKGINELIEAFVRLRARHNNIKLILVGDFEKDLDPISKNAEELIENSQDILTVGYQSDIRPFLSASNVLTFPSYREGFPNVVMQAAAMQLNCIVSDINGCNEIIEDGVNGWVVPVKNTEALENKMEWCLKNTLQSEQMGRKSRESIMANYERRNVWKAIHEEYQSLLLINR